MEIGGEQAMDQREIDKQNTRKGIDYIIERHGNEILKFLQESGILVEGQYYLSRAMIEKELDYLEDKLVTLGLPFFSEEDENGEIVEHLPRLFCGFHEASDEIDGNYFYYAVYEGHDNTQTREDAKEVALQVYKSEIISKWLETDC